MVLKCGTIAIQEKILSNKVYIESCQKDCILLIFVKEINMKEMQRKLLKYIL